MEGLFNWESISLDEFIKFKNNKLNAYDYKQNKQGYFKKRWGNKIIFSNHNFDFRANKGIHDAIQTIKFWPTDTIWFINYKIRKTFDRINKNRLLNLLTRYFKDDKLKILISTIINFKTIQKQNILFNKEYIPEDSILFSFLFNIYMHEFDMFIELLIRKNSFNKNYDSSTAISKKYDRIIDKFHSSKAHITLKKYGSPKAV